MIRISLSEEDFKYLVAGKVVTRRVEPGYGQVANTVEITLQDVGWMTMIRAIKDSAYEAGNAKK